MLPLSNNEHSRFPKLKECAHFHYDFVDLGAVQLSLDDEQRDFHDGSSGPASNNGIMLRPEIGRERSWRFSDGGDSGRYYIRVCSRDKAWVVRQSFEGFRSFDRQLHRCIYDRKFSLLPELEGNDVSTKSQQELRKLLSVYLKRFSTIACNMINCGSVLTWMEMDNRGNHLVAPDNGAINVPAVAAGHVVKRYVAQSLDELSMEVGDIVSIIDMPPANESSWWQGKCKFQVGFFPSECVQVISGAVPEAMTTKLPPKPVLHKRGKLISFLRAFFSSRPTRSQLKQTGIVKERVFGCDLGEHLQNSGHEVPLVLQVCAQAIESHGIVDGIYRLSGVASNIQKLRNTFDEDRVPEMTEDLFVQDVHCISSLLKMYFRELPNPLFTYQLYDKFALAMEEDETRLTSIYDVVRQLPPPHYRTASYLMRHLCRIASHSTKTNMHCKNLAIVWAPNLFRSKELEQIQCSTAALSGVGIQAIITEYLIMYADVLFIDGAGNSGVSTIRHRPKSLMPLPSKLLSLEEAQERALLKSPRQKYIDVGGGPLALPHDYHTVVDLPKGKKSRKERKPSLSGLKAIFSRSRSGSYHSNYSERGSVNEPPFQVRHNPVVKPSNNSALTNAADLRRCIRMAKSVDMLCSMGRNETENYRRPVCNVGSIIANPYAEENWLSVSQATLSKGSGRPRTKSCNSSLSDSSDLEEHCSTFIKPLQSSPQNSLKQRSRYSDVPSNTRTSAFSQKPFEPYGRSHGKENCDFYRSIAHNAASQPRISLASRFNIPPEVPKRSTSLYIDSFDNDALNCRSDIFLSGSKSLATVDSCPIGAAVNLPLPPPSYSPRYSSSPSQSDHSDEIFNCGIASCEIEHPLTPICEMQTIGGGEACHRSWEMVSSSDAPAMFSVWMDSLCRKDMDRISVDQLAAVQSNDGASFCVKQGPVTGLPASDSDTKESEDLPSKGILQKDDLVERWEVPTLVSGSAFVTGVDEFLNSQSLNQPPAKQEEFISTTLPFLEISYHSSKPLGDDMQPCDADFRRKQYSTLVEMCDRQAWLSQSPSTPPCSMEFSDDSEYENEVTPTEEHMRSLDSNKRVLFGTIGEGINVDRAEENKKSKSNFTSEDVEVTHSFNTPTDTEYLDIYSKDMNGLGVDFSTEIDNDPFKDIHQNMDFLEKDNEMTEVSEEDKKIDMTGPVCLPMKSSLYETLDKLEHLLSDDTANGHTCVAETEKQTSMELMDSASVQKRKAFVTDTGESYDSDDHFVESETWNSECDSARLIPLQGDGDFANELYEAAASYYRASVENVSTVVSDSIVTSFDQNPSTVSCGDSLSEECSEIVEQNDSVLDVFGQNDQGSSAECKSEPCESVSSFPLAATPDEKISLQELLETSRGERYHSWVCVAMTGIPNTEQSTETSAQTPPDSECPEHESDSRQLAFLSSLQSPTMTDRKKDDVPDDTDADQVSWKSSLSLTSCLLQLCADGYVADHSNSSSPVMTDHSMWSSHTKAVPHETSNVIFSSSSIGGVCDIPTSAVSSEPKYVEPLHGGIESDRPLAKNDSNRQSLGSASERNLGKESVVAKSELAESRNWSVDNQATFGSSESDAYCSASELHQRNSPVRRKSVRELKNRFESTAADTASVRPMVKKRPPVAKKPSVVRSSALLNSSSMHNSADVLLDSTSCTGLVLVTTNALDASEVSCSQGCATAPVTTENRFSFADCSLTKSSASVTDDPMKRSVESRPSSARSCTSDDNSVRRDHKYDESMQDGNVSLETDKNLGQSKYETCVNNEIELFTRSQAQFPDQYFDKSSVSGQLPSSSRCSVSGGASSLENSEAASVNFKPVQRIEDCPRERCFATVAFPGDKSVASIVRCTQSVDPSVFVNDDKETVCDERQTCDQDFVRSREKLSGGNRSGCLPVSKPFSRRSMTVDANASSCESLSFVGVEAHGTPPNTLQDPSVGTSASPGPAEKPAVGRVRGLSAMFEQQSLERSECAQGRRESSQGQLRPQDISGRNSQVWKGHPHSSGEGEVTNQTLRNVTIKL